MTSFLPAQPARSPREKKMNSDVPIFLVLRSTIVFIG
jgi:hypothetical protein